MYALQTRSGAEDQVKVLLENTVVREDESLWIPMKKRLLRYTRRFRSVSGADSLWGTVEERLLPGYILLNTPDPWDFKNRIVKTPHHVMIRLIGRSHEMEMDDFSELYEEEILMIKKLCGGVSRGIKEGDKVRITEGPLKDLPPAWVKRIDRHKRYAVVMLPFMGREVEIKLSVEVLSSVQ